MFPICAKRVRNGLASADQGLSTAKTTAMCTACHEYANPPPSIPLFWLTQNLSSKRIAATNNVTKVRRHQIVSVVAKGLIKKKKNEL